MGALMLPLVLLLVAVIGFFGMFGSALTNVQNGGTVTYNERTFQDYANQQYLTEFESSSAYEDNILIVFLTNEEADGYYTIAWVGDNLKTQINEQFGNEYTVFGRAMQSSIDTDYYAYSISSNLASVMDKMTDSVTKLNLESSFKVEEDHSEMVESHLTNRSNLAINEETVERSLRGFTEATDIPVVMVVDSMENVFGKSINSGDILTLVVFAGMAAVAIWLIVKAIKGREGNPDD